MKDEIKEILKDLEFASGIFDYTITPDRCTFLKDYITNLQEENEKVHKDFAELSERYFFTKSRNEKAIEYIKQNSKCGGSFIDDKFVIEYIDEIFNGMELLNILNGDDE